MAKMVNFMSRVFYHSNKIKKKKEFEIPFFGLRFFPCLKIIENSPPPKLLLMGVISVNMFYLDTISL